MSKPSNSAVHSILAALCFWLGSQPLFMGVMAYYKFWLGEGVGYEGGLGGFVGGSFLWAMFTTVPAAVFFVAVLIRLMLFGKRGSVDTVRLCVYSGILGLSWPLLLVMASLW
jgi:uncharacterized membrane protein